LYPFPGVRVVPPVAENEDWEIIERNFLLNPKLEFIRLIIGDII
jgi:hypothetical protein